MHSAVCAIPRQVWVSIRISGKRECQREAVDIEMKRKKRDTDGEMCQMSGCPADLTFCLVVLWLVWEEISKHTCKLPMDAAC
jgi:hypothetical protein